MNVVIRFTKRPCFCPVIIAIRRMAYAVFTSFPALVPRAGFQLNVFLIGGDREERKNLFQRFAEQE